MNITLPLEVLESEARTQTGAEARLREVKLHRLEGGYIAIGVYRVDLVFDQPAGTQQVVSFVQKYAASRELGVLKALRELKDAAVPRLIAGEEYGEEQAWLIYPYTPGETLTDQDPLPLGVLRMLARTHAHFAGQLDAFPDVLRVDAGFFRRAFATGIAALTSKQDMFAVENEQLMQVRDDPRLYEALRQLPLTLTHGDVHAGNLIHAGEGSAVLIDWGNARLAPGALDLANMVEYGSSQWTAYLEAWEEAAGRQSNARLAELGYRWAVIQVNTQYLPYAVNYLPPEYARNMVAKTMAAQARIAELLG